MHKFAFSFYTRENYAIFFFSPKRIMILINADGNVPRIVKTIVSKEVVLPPQMQLVFYHIVGPGSL